MLSASSVVRFVFFSNSQVESVEDLHRLLDRDAIGAALEVEVLRAGKRARFLVRPGEIPLAPAA